MIEAQIKHMVDRFLGWKLPRDTFNPDCGISFDKGPINAHTDYPSKYEPSGTNLLDAQQADAMVRYMVDGMPAVAGEQSDFRWLIEAPGIKYLATRRIGGSTDFHWTADHNAALALKDKAAAHGLMMAVRQMQPDLFAFERTLGDAKAVEHGWG